MNYDMMIDLETLGTSVNSVVLTIGAIKFERNKPILPLSDIPEYLKFYKRIDIPSCEAIGLQKDKNTLEWWKKQSREVYNEAFSEVDRKPIKNVLLELNSWFGTDVNYVWSQGTDFDIGILRNIYEKLKMETPWKFYNVRDSRTVIDLANIKRFQSTDLHNSLSDSWRQIIDLQNALKKFQNFE
jgi:hypothetical protein